MKHVKLLKEFIVENKSDNSENLTSILYDKLSKKIVDFIHELSPSYRVVVFPLDTYNTYDKDNMDFYIHYYFHFCVESLRPENKCIVEYISIMLDKYYEKDKKDGLYSLTFDRYITFDVGDYKGNISEKSINKIEFSKEEYEIWLNSKKFGL